MFFAGQPAILACGPFSIDPIFTFTKHGDYPIRQYTSGQPGVVPNSYGRISLYAFYRELNNKPFTKGERIQVTSAIEHRIGYEPETAANSEDLKNTPKAAWERARSQIFDEKTTIETDKPIRDSYYSYSNCLPDSFVTATKTLQARIAKYGKSDDVKSWVSAQDSVFTNCNDSGTMPASTPENAPYWLRADRAYQVAAANFYAGNFVQARKDFLEIAADDKSPWQATSRFVATRSLIRDASLLDTEDKPENKSKQTSLFNTALTELNSIVADPNMNAFHASAKRLLGYVNFRVSPDERRVTLAKRLSDSEENSNIYNDLTDYIWLLDQTEAAAYDAGYEIDQQAAEAAGNEYFGYRLKLRDVPENKRADDLTDWLYTYQAVDGADHAFAMYETTNALHWFVVAITKADAKSPEAESLIREAGKVDQNYAGYATIVASQVRLLLQLGKSTEARTILDTFFTKHFSHLSQAAKNRFLSLKMGTATNMDEFLKTAQRKAVAFVWSDDFNEVGDDISKQPVQKLWSEREMFDADSAAFFNSRMPIAELRKAAESQALPPYLREMVLPAAWIRAVVLYDQKDELPLAKEISQTSLNYGSSFVKYLNAKNETEREAYRLLTILSYPILDIDVGYGTGRGTTGATEIDSFRGNWWCSEFVDPYDESTGFIPEPQFLSAADREKASAEIALMKKSGNSATYLTRRTIKFAQANPRNPLTPQLLHLAVRSTRYGCTDGNTGTYSKQAFEILHSRYPKSKWTAQTPYWFS